MSQKPRAVQDWRAGKSFLYFEFCFTNYGSSPAIVRDVLAYAFFSKGPRRGGDEETIIVKEFPTAGQLPYYLLQFTKLFVVEQGTSPVLDDLRYGAAKELPRGKMFVLKPGETSGKFRQAIPTDPLVPADPVLAGVLGERTGLKRYLYEVTSASGHVEPWFLARIIYEDTLGRTHRTSLCVRGEHDGGVVEECAAPYNERT